MSLVDHFQSAVVDLFRAGGGGPDLLPKVLVQACVAVLPTTGAGLSMTDHLRIPLAASDSDAALAERLQTTMGEGPCLSAVELDHGLVADAAEIAASWPTFSEAFLAQTSYRSVASVPLRSAGGMRMGALDLYSTDPQPLSQDILKDIELSVAIPIASMLFREPVTHDATGAPTLRWLDSDAAQDRMNVWVAIGMLMARLDLPNDDALAVLRGYAYSHGQTLDDIARDLTAKRLEPDQIVV